MMQLFGARSLLLALCTLFLFSFADAQEGYRKVRFAELTKAGVRSFAPTARQLSGMRVDGNRLSAEKGYTMWINARKWFVFVPEEVENPAPIFSTQAGFITVDLIGGGTLVIVCVCAGENGGDPDKDDCEVDVPISDVQNAACKGACGCRRINGFIPSEPGVPLVQDVVH